MLGDLQALWQWLVPQRFDWLQIEVSSHCNAACEYCPVTHHRYSRGAGFIDDETFSNLEGTFPSADLVFLQGWGEPLLHPHFFTLVRKVKAAGTRVGFATNGILLTAENVQHLLETGVDVMAVSLAGTRAATHERLRKGCDFGRIDTALKELKREKKALDRAHPGVHVAFTLLRSNWQELNELPRLALEWGADQVVVSNLTLVINEQLERESLLLDPDLWPEVRARLDEVRQEAAERGIGLHYYEPDFVRPQPTCPENVVASCFVSHRGDVAPCVLANLGSTPGSDVRFRFRGSTYTPSRLAFGNVNQQSLADIWRTDAARSFRYSHKRRLLAAHPAQEQLPEPCDRCYKLYESSSV
jgi:MoaA/NifB/PqqE/SkfB family radical SAM enzyme